MMFGIFIILPLVGGFIVFIIGVNLAVKKIKRLMKTDPVFDAITRTIIDLRADPTSLISICLFIGSSLFLAGLFFLLDFLGVITI
jgi:hypothetical protein